MKPLITRPEHIAQCVAQRRRWKGQERVDVLEQCMRMIHIWQTGARITREKAMALRMQVAPVLSAEKARWRAEQEANSLTETIQTTPTSSNDGETKEAPASSTEPEPSVEPSTPPTEPRPETSTSSNGIASGRRRSTRKRARSRKGGSSSTKKECVSSNGKAETGSPRSGT
ncbi:MAG: hypothetical protein GY832_11125 [Chloroflexi bacterium]|nr:hypothetical protein [Chloroflexota bacterium]